MSDPAAGPTGALGTAAPEGAGVITAPALAPSASTLGLLSGGPMGTFDADGNYLPRPIVEDDLGAGSLDDAIAGTIVEFDDGDIVEGTVVKIDKDEVLLDIGFKSEGVIPARELSIRNDVDPHEIVSLGDRVEALVLQKEDKEGRLVLSKKRAQYERAWGTIEAPKESRTVRGPKRLERPRISIVAPSRAGPRGVLAVRSSVNDSGSNSARGRVVAALIASRPLIVSRPRASRTRRGS